MAKAEQLLSDALTRAKTLVQANGHSADYKAFLGRLEFGLDDLNPRAVSVLAFSENIKTETKEGVTRPFANPVGAAIRLALSVEAHAKKTESNLESGIIAQQMIADIKRCFMASPWSTAAKQFIYSGASWQPPENDVLSVSVQFICEYSTRRFSVGWSLVLMT